jgi:FKBP-type peptidyl-prolyl cis-trans isomerase
MPSPSNSRTRPEVRKSSVTSAAPARRGATTQAAVNRRAIRAARRAAERRRRNAWLIGTFTALIVVALIALVLTHLPQAKSSTSTNTTHYNCATPTPTTIGPVPALKPAATPPALPSDVTLQTKAVKYTDSNNVSQTANMQYAVLKEGCGPAVVGGDTIITIYSGWVQSTGKLFDSSLEHSPSQCGGTITGSCGFTIGQNPPAVIAGWEGGIPGMKPGETIRLIIPPELAYGATGQTDQNTGAVIIPPNATLIFDITLVSIASGAGS